jgi:predicted membrane-bound mannosyltransferase
MDPQQRYCVDCAARRGNGANPASRYFAAMSKKTKRPPARAGQRQPSGSRAAAVSFFALLPIAVAIGVVVGRAGTGGEDSSAILQALREQNAATASAGTAAGATASTAAKKDGAKNGSAKPTKGHGKVVAKTQYGTVHQVTGYHASKQTEDEGQKLVEDNVEQTGSNYIQAQTNLPDVTVVGGNPDEAPALPTGGQP